MTDKSSKVVPFGILIGILAGAALGAVVPGFMQAIDFIGRLFINALQVVVVPLILAAIISGVASFGDLPKIGRTGARVIAYFAATSAIAVIIGLVLALVINPGSGVSEEALKAYALPGGYPTGNVSDMLSALIPLNLPAGIVGGQYLGLILFSIFAGGILATMGAGARTVTTFFRQFNDVIMKLVRLLLYAAPVGVFSIVGSAVASNSGSVEGLTRGFGWYALTILIGLAIQAFVVLPVILGRFTGRSPVDYLRSLSPALMTALGTSSSAATLPVTYRCAVDDGHVDQRAGALVLPLGAVANLNGTAMSVIVATLFLANVFGLTLGAMQIAVMVATTLLVSIGVAGMPMATPIVTTIVLSVVGFSPVQILLGTSAIMALDWLVDRGRAFVNVWGDAVGVAVIAETFEFKTARRVASRPSDRGRDAARPPRSRTRSDSDRGRSRPDSRTPRKPARASSGPRTGRGSKPASERPAPQERRGRGRAPQRAAESESPFGITAASTPILDTNGGAPPKETSKPEPVADRPPQRARTRDDSPRSSGGPRQREAAGDRGRSQRQEREPSEPKRPARRSAPRERKPVARKPEEARPPQRRESSPQPPPTVEPQAPAPAPAPAQPEVPAATTPAEAVTSNGRLKPSTVARELAKVSAQLAVSAAAEEASKAERDNHRPPPAPRDQKPEPRDASVGSDRPSPAPDAPATERPDRAFPPSNVAVKAAAPASPEPAPPRAEPQREASPETPAPLAEAKARPETESPKTESPVSSRSETASGTEGDRPQFGRSRAKKGVKPARDKAPGPSAVEDKPKVPSGYSTESATFGRGKKKRTR